VSENGRTAAFFDVDNTLVVGASIYHFARGLASRDFFTTWDVIRFGSKQISFRVSGSESAGMMERAEAAALSFVTGMRQDDLVTLGEQIYDEKFTTRVFAETVALARAHLDAGDEVWLVTASGVEIAELLARRLGLTGGLGTISEVVDGRYTGRKVGPTLHGQAKADAVRDLAEERGIDLLRSSAYSDSANDLPLLRMVGHPRAINPDRTLLRIARSQGWPVFDHRRRRAIALTTTAVAGAGLAVLGVGYTAARLRRRG
jgi:HAD superfamily hydrolase (TIGR01490 family)